MELKFQKQRDSGYSIASPLLLRRAPLHFRTARVGKCAMRTNGAEAGLIQSCISSGHPSLKNRWERHTRHNTKPWVIKYTSSLVLGVGGWAGDPQQWQLRPKGNKHWGTWELSRWQTQQGLLLSLAVRGGQ